MRLLAALLLGSAPASAAVIVAGPPTGINVTIYREQARAMGGQIDLDRLAGFAVVTEKRRVRLPAGTHTLRFEGVAEGILSVSAVIDGLPQGVVEKNRDARTLSPAALIEAALGQTVTLRRTDPATGEATETRATVLSGAGGAPLFRTAAGIEALRCSTLPETLIFDRVPEGLSDKPVLSVLATADRAVEAEVTLAYLARGFDWTANYVARFAADGRTLDLTGWVTLANGGSTGFANARAQVVAGSVEKQEDAAQPDAGDGAQSAQCWPWDTTSTAPTIERFRDAPGSPEVAYRAMAMAAPRMALDADTIVVTGARREELGDLKLYTVPRPTTVAARAQKQVLLLDKRGVAYRTIYSFRREAGAADDGDAGVVLRILNEAAEGLGEPLPSGSIALFDTGSTALAARTMLVGEARVRDAAVGEKIELEAGDAPDVRAETREVAKGRFEVRLTNAGTGPAAVEYRMSVDGGARVVDASERLSRIDGDDAWAVTVPAGGSARLNYRVEDD